MSIAARGLMHAGRVGVALPVSRTRWVYCVVGVADDGAGASGATPTTRTTAGGWRQGSEDALRRLGRRLQREAGAFWADAAAAPRESVKGRVHALVDGALARVPSEETFLRDIAAGLDAVPQPLQVHYPDSVGLDAMRAQLHALADVGASYHRRWLIASAAALPFTFALTVIPGPNVFLYYNVYRTFSHWRALSGARALAEAAGAAPHGHVALGTGPLLTVSLHPRKDMTALLTQQHAGGDAAAAAGGAVTVTPEATRGLVKLFHAPEIGVAVHRAQLQAARREGAAGHAPPPPPPDAA